jgi:NADH-quinone oxidoreductase subunit G
VVDICPVGALVSKDFLFKQRAWDLDHTPSVCPNCTQGCNIELHTRDNLVQRLKPRPNPDVNSFWMCDYGRARYEWINRGDRVEVPLLRRADGAGTRAVGWGEALAFLVKRLGELDGAPVRAVVTPYASNEELAALSSLVRHLGGSRVSYRLERAPDEVVLEGFPTLARRRDLAPNVRGAEIFKASRVGGDDGTGGLDEVSSAGGVILVLGDDLSDQPDDFGASADLYVYLGQHGSRAASRAHAVLPVTSFAEHEGTFTNVQGRVQRFWPALEPPGAARPAWLVLGHLLAALGGPAAPATAEEACARMAGATAELDGLTYQGLGTQGALLNEPVSLTGRGVG